MVQGIEEQAGSLFVGAGRVASIDAVAEIQTTPITRGWCRWRAIGVHSDPCRIVDRGDNDFAVGNTQQLQGTTAAIDRDGRTSDADPRSPHLDDRPGIDHHIDVPWNVECCAVSQGLAESVESDFISSIRCVAQDADRNGAGARGIGIAHRSRFGQSSRNGVVRLCEGSVPVGQSGLIDPNGVRTSVGRRRRRTIWPSGNKPIVEHSTGFAVAISIDLGRIGIRIGQSRCSRWCKVDPQIVSAFRTPA